jgi:Mrp family chromosome partitioning ATPase
MKRTDMDNTIPTSALDSVEEPNHFSGDWEDVVSRVLPLENEPKAAGTETSEAWLPSPPGSFQTGLDSSYEEFSQLFAAIERHGDSVTADMDALSNRNGRILGITSALVGEGKTTVALNLAMSTARSTNSKVCLIDLGLSGDSVLKRLGTLGQGPGIIHVLEGGSATLQKLKLRDYEELTIIPAGKVPHNSAKIARSVLLEEVLCSIRRMFDIILVDMPAIATHNARPMAAHMDGIVMIVQAGVTPHEVITNAMDHVGREKVLGVVLNRVRFSGPRWLQERLMKR